MKKLVSVLLCILLLALPSAAHPGRTDSDGGHTDHSTGEYHYHHGQPAHQHTGGDCPYNWRTTPYYSKSSSSSSSSKSETRTYYASKVKAERDAAEAEKAAAKQREKENAYTKVLRGIYFFAVFMLAAHLANIMDAGPENKNHAKNGIGKFLLWIRNLPLAVISSAFMLSPLAIILFIVYNILIKI